MMKQYANTIERKLLSAFFRAKQTAYRTKEALENNQGDTHFLAMLAAMAVVAVIAVLFKTEFTNLFNLLWEKLKAIITGLLG